MRELSFSADRWKSLSVHERVLYCRRMAQGLRSLAMTERTAANEYYFDLAERWTEFAEALELQTDQNRP